MKRSLAAKEIKPSANQRKVPAAVNARRLAVSLCAFLAMPLALLAQAPSFLLQPTNRNICFGFNTTFAAVAMGSAPLRYQWFRNGTPIQDATNSSFTLSNLSFADAATFQAVVTNALGSTPSSNAVLVVGRVAAWGASPGGGLIIPLNVTNLTAIAAGGHRLGLRSDGTVVAWGGNTFGQTNVPPGLSAVVQVAAGSADAYSLALKSDGTVVAWGQNSNGETNVPAGLSNVVKVAAGARHVLALRDNGTIMGWGYSAGNVRNLSSLLDKFTDVAAGYDHSVTVTRDGRVQTYGSNSQGQQNIPSTATNVISVVCSTYHTLALKADGTVVAWGQNSSGQCNVPAGLSNVVAISAGSSTSHAITQDGAVVSWGDNSAGQGNTPAPFTNAVMVACEGPRTFGLRGFGEPWITVQPRSQSVIARNPLSLHARAVGNPPLAYQWLFNGAALTDATNASLTIAELQLTNAGDYQLVVSNPLGSATSTVATVTVRPRLGLAAWGLNGYGQNHPPSGLTNIKQVVAGDYHTLVLKDDGTVAVWGSINFGQAMVPPSVTNVVAIAAGGNNLVIKSDGKVAAWGSQGLTSVPAMSAEAIAVAAGTTHNLALLANGTTVGWDMGNSISDPHYSWSGIKAISMASSAGDDHSLGLKADGTLVNYLPSGYTPLIPPMGLSNIVAISCGGYFDMVLKSDGTVVAWGNNGFGQTNVPTGLSNVVAISAGAGHAAALQADGTLVCWGGNANGQCTTPVNLTNVFDLKSGIGRTLALVGDGFPVISMQPRSRGVPVDRPIELRVTATGTAPLSYQWHFNGAPLPGETNIFLTISNMQPARIGDYRVTVSNALGVATSQVARLNTTLVFAWGANASEECFVPPDATNVASLAAGYSHGLALRTDRSVVGWGDNNYGQSQPPSNATNLALLSAGGASSMGLRVDGSTIGWGNNYQGALDLPPQASNTVSLAVGDNYTLALQADGRVIAWGYGPYGQTNVPPDLTNAVSVAAGSIVSLALRDNGTIAAWGNQTSPASISNVVSIAAMGSVGLALHTDGTLAPWGFGTSAPATATNVVAIALGANNATALRRDGSLVVWGSNQHTPPSGMSNVVSIASGLSFGIAVTGNGKPVITVQPFKRAVVAGNQTTLAVMAVGNQPMSYQWLFNGTNLLGATGSTFTLSNIPVTQAGNFQCIVSNALGVVTSAVATLTVTRPPIQFSPAPAATFVTNGVFQTRVSGLSAAGPITFFTSTNLVNWQPIFTNPPVVGSLDFTYPTTNSPARFFRASESP